VERLELRLEMFGRIGELESFFSSSDASLFRVSLRWITVSEIRD